MSYDNFLHVSRTYPKEGRVSRTSRSQPAMIGAKDVKSRGETMMEIEADMKRCKASMLQLFRHASRQGRFRVHPGAGGQPSTSAGVA